MKGLHPSNYKEENAEFLKQHLYGALPKNTEDKTLE
jgi:hypothetical protein